MTSAASGVGNDLGKDTERSDAPRLRIVVVVVVVLFYMSGAEKKSRRKFKNCLVLDAFVSG
jgi:hypothetical protein